MQAPAPDAAGSIALGLVLGTTGVFGFTLVRAFQGSHRARERAPESSGEAFVTAAITLGALYWALDMNWTLFKSIAETGELPKDVW